MHAYTLWKHMQNATSAVKLDSRQIYHLGHTYDL